MKYILREISILRQLTQQDSIFTPKLYQIIIPKEEIKDLRNMKCLFIVMECTKHSLLDVIEDTEHEKQEVQFKTIIYNLLCGINFIHQTGIIHRDIKPENILVDRYGQIKICDFGLSRSLNTNFNDKESQYTTELGHQNIYKNK